MSQKLNATGDGFDRELTEAKRTVRRLFVALAVGITVGLCWILGVVEGGWLTTALVGWGVTEFVRFLVYDVVWILRRVVLRT